MKSTLIFKFLDTPVIDDTIVVEVDNGSYTTLLSLSATSQRLSKGFYEINYLNPSVNQSTYSYISAWNKDHKNVGGFDNIQASVIFDPDIQIQIVIEDENWTFTDFYGNSLTSNDIELVSITNAPEPTNKSYTHALTGADCLNADYSIAITGGVSPYTILGLPSGTVTNVPASSTFQLRRGTPATVRVQDSEGVLIESKSITPPKKLRGSNFTINVVPENGWNTANVSPNVVIQDEMLPITYSLNGTDYVSAGSFSDLDFEQNYTMYIKDAFDCVVQKTFVTLEDFSTDLNQQYFRESFISNAGTLIFSERQELTESTRKNPNNTLSCSEVAQLPYSYVHEIVNPDRLIVQQFKSSYNYHKITLLTNGIAKYIEPILQAENLNQIEKVDAVLFRSLTGNMGMYFDGGDTYLENTSTSNGTSYYGTNTPSEQDWPSWGMVGQKLVIDGIGVKTVSRVTTDPQRGLYLEFAETYTDNTDTDVKVQVNFNRQTYNTYEFGIPYSEIDESGRVIIEKGFNGLVERTYISELIKIVPDDPNRYLIEWSDPYNKSGIVHQTGIGHFAWLYARLNHKTVSVSELDNSDTDVFNLDQEAYTVADFETAVQGFKMENKLALASGMENFYINGIPYKKESMESEIQGDSNIRVIKALFRMGGNELVINDDEIVLDPPSTPLTAKTPSSDAVGTYLAYSEDGLVVNGDGSYIVVDV